VWQELDTVSTAEEKYTYRYIKHTHKEDETHCELCETNVRDSLLMDPIRVDLAREQALFLLNRGRNQHLLS